MTLGNPPKPSRRKGPRPRKIPQRTCVACRSGTAKRDLIRLVRTPDEGVVIDATGRRAGRGAYLCRFGECWEVGLQRKAIDRALKTELTQENREALAQFAVQLPRTPPPGG